MVDVAAGEECDDGAIEAGDGCSDRCLFEYCGNGIVDAGEVCDDGNVVSGDSCSSDCASDETCGNGIVDVLAGEDCDGGNVVSGDGCDATCEPSVGWECTGSASVCFGVSIFDDFELYNVGDQLGLVSDDWIPWLQTGGGVDDVAVVDTDAYSGTQSIHLTNGTSGAGGPQDLLMLFGGDYTTGVAWFGLSLHVETGKNAYFNFQHRRCKHLPRLDPSDEDQPGCWLLGR